MRRVGLLLAALAALAGCGGGPRVTETRDVAPYSALEVGGSINVDVVSGDAREVIVTGGRDVIGRVVTESENGVLQVRIRDRGIVIGPDPFDDVRVQVSAAGLDTIRVEGSGDLELGRIEADRLNVEVDGAADISARGQVGALTATIEGAGDANLADLETRTARVVVRGAGDAELWVTEELDVAVEGAGDVTYRGNPSVSQRVEGAGEVRPAD